MTTDHWVCRSACYTSHTVLWPPHVKYCLKNFIKFKSHTTLVTNSTLRSHCGSVSLNTIHNPSIPALHDPFLGGPCAWIAGISSVTVWYGLRDYSPGTLISWGPREEICQVTYVHCDSTGSSGVVKTRSNGANNVLI